MEEFIKILKDKIEELKEDQLGTASLLTAKHSKIIKDIDDRSWASAEDYLETIQAYNEVKSQIQILEEIIEELEEEELED